MFVGYFTDHTVLHNYIEAAQVTVCSTSMSEYDDLPGLGGIQVHDSYQLCLYFSKGLAQYVAISSILIYIIPIALTWMIMPIEIMCGTVVPL